MANTGFKGRAVRQTGNQLLFDKWLLGSDGTDVTTGTTAIDIFEVQSDGTYKSYDFNDNTFKTTALTTPTVNATHRTGNNSTTNTGRWTYALSTLTGFTVGGMYRVRYNNANAYPQNTWDEFQYGSAEGDLVTTAGATGVAYLQGDVTLIKTQTVTCAAGVTVGPFVGNATAALGVDASGRVDLGKILGTAVVTPATAGVLDVNVKNYNNQTAATDANNLPKVDTEDWKGGVIPAVNVTGVPKVDLVDWLGSAPAALAATFVQVDIRAVNADTTAPANVANTYNGTGYFAATAPAQQQQVANIAVTGAALNKTASSLTLTTGTDTGGVANTNTLDGVFDSWADTAGTIDGYYQFDLSGTTNAVAVGVTWDGYLVGVVNTLKVYAYNWGNTTWDQVGSVIGVAGTLVSAQEWDLTSAHTGTGGNAGLIRIRFNATGLTAATLKTDRILVGYVVTPNTTTPPTVGAIATQIWQDLTAGSDFGTAGSIGALLKADIDTTISSRSSYAGGDTSGTTTLLSRLTSGRATNLDNLDTAISTRMATFSLPANFAALGISATGHILIVDTLTTYTGNTPQSGDAYNVVKAGGTGDAAAIKAKTDNLPAAPASTTNITGGTITTVTNLTNAPTAGDFTAAMKTSLNNATPSATVSDKTGFSLAATGLNLVLVGGKTLPNAMEYIAASAAGVVSGAGSGTESFKGLDGVLRLTITVDASGNRSAVVYG